MMTKTVENSKIRVSIPMLEWDTRVSKCRAWNGETQEQVARGRLLSDAMAKIGYSSRVKADYIIDQRDIHGYVEMILMKEFLSEKTRYGYGETLNRYLNGRRLSEGMQRECTDAIMYAYKRMLEDTSLVETMESEYIKMNQSAHMAWETRLDGWGKFGSWEIEIIDRSQFPSQIGLTIIDPSQVPCQAHRDNLPCFL